MYLQCNLSEPGLSTGVDVSEIASTLALFFSKEGGKILWVSQYAT
jgi:hypothetical protein